MKPQRRQQQLPAWAHCRRHGCPWKEAGFKIPAAVEADAARHVDQTGHEVRVVTSAEIVLTRPVLVHLITASLDVACGHDDSDDFSAVPREVTCPACRKSPAWAAQPKAVTR